MSGPSQPAISVILPVRNGMPYLPRAIDSILTQTWTDFELLVIDDRSVDQTRAYLTTIDDARVRVLRPDTGGLADALNTGLRAARAPYLARQDADDWSSRHRLASQMAWLLEHPGVDILATAVDFVDATDAAVADAWTERIRAQWDVATTPTEIAALLPLTCCLFHATVMTRTDLLRRAGGYDPAMVPAEDYDLWLRLLPHARFARHARALYTVRVHEASSSARRRDDQIDRVITAKLRHLRRVCPGLPRRASLALPCAGRGAHLFQRIAPREDFVVTGPDGGRAWATADVVAVTDFSALDHHAAALTVDDRYRQVGNLFVRTDFVSATESGPYPRRTGGEPKASLERC